MKNDQEFTREMEKCRSNIDKRLSELLVSSKEICAGLIESMKYSLLAGGKRIRPIMCVKFCEAAGGNPENALDAACAVEMMHTYSLIHDDLPCMDNSDLRRGKPSNHVKFGEYTATLAGDALQATAFEVLLNSALPSNIVVEMTRILAQSSGAHGICGGQFLDLQSAWKTPEVNVLTEIHNLKTAALVSAAARIGVIAAGGTEEQVEAAEKYALAVGFSFQVRDDVLDITAIERELGKPFGSDLENNKLTFATLLGIDKCEALIYTETAKAVSALNEEFTNTGFLVWFTHMLADRKY